MSKNLTQEEMQRMSTRVLLATLSIPISPERADISRFLDMDGIASPALPVYNKQAGFFVHISRHLFCTVKI